MKNICNIIQGFCSSRVSERISRFYEILEKRNLIPPNTYIEKDNLDINNNNLLFVSYNENTKRNLQSLMEKINLKRSNIIIISNNDENYFDFAIEHNICNIIHIERLNERLLLGILKRFFGKKLGLKAFFEKKTNIFSKQYSLSGSVSMYSLVENEFTDFIDAIPSIAKNTFKINCHELVTNALAYGVLGITPLTRDKKIYDLGNKVTIPQGKEVLVRLAMNSEIYGISVKDFGGSLTINRVLERIRRQSVVAGETIPQGIEDYTGRGLAILSHHGLLTFSIKPKEFTEVSFMSRLETIFEKRPIAILATKH
jgi:hypothetical protein|uniref:Uncharacterized protein n=1 Tax=uncultured bacterium contig00085 TaxID=1181558 RepID=A0A806KHX7_9BACT|nr:hypothetical protein [uncultured bacterium contig00085]